MARCFMFFFILTSCRVAGQSPIYALKGQKVTLKPAIIGQPKEILWKYQGNKVVEFNGNEQTAYSPYKERIILDWISAELNITNLTYEDSGEYELEVYMNQELKRSPFLLEVIDRVATPSISCEMEDGSSSATLVCSAESRQHQSLLEFQWESDGHVHPGPTFTISLGDKHDDEIYMCRVYNPLTYETAIYTAKDCYPDKSPSTALIASILTIAIILLIVVALVVCFKLRHKARFSKGNRDLEHLSTKGSDEKTAHGDEKQNLLGREPTIPSTQPLHFQNLENSTDKHEETASPPSSLCGTVQQIIQQFEPTSGGNISVKKLLRGTERDNKGDADADRLREAGKKEIPQGDPSDSVEENEPDSPGVLEDTQPNQESSTAPEQPDLENSTDKHEETASPPSSLCGTVQQIKQQFEPTSGGNILAKKLQRGTERDDKGKADADRLREAAKKEIPQGDPSDSEKANEADSPGVLEDTQPNQESSTAPEQPESKKNTDDEVKA